MITSAATKPLNYPLFIITIALISVIGLISSDIHLPAFPGIGEYFKVNQERVQSTLSVYLLGISISQLFYGSLTDRFGRKSVLLCGMVIYITASIACAFAESIEILIIGRFFQAVGACSGMVISRAIVNDLYGKEGSAKIFTTIFPIVGVSPAIAPLIGGFLTYYFNFRANFIFLIVFGIITIGMVFIALKESLPSKIPLHPITLFKNYFHILTNPLFIGYSLLVCAAYGAYFAYLSASPFIFNKLGYTPDKTGFFYISVSLTYIAGNITGKKMIKSISIDKALRFGALIFCIGGIGMYLITLKGIVNPLLIIIPMSILTFGNGFLLPLGVASSIGSASNLAGTASGLMGFLQLGSAAICAKLVGGIKLARGAEILPPVSLQGVILGCCLVAVVGVGVVWGNRQV